MDLKVQKKLAARYLDVSPKRVLFNEDYLDEIKETVTRQGIANLVKQGIIVKKQKSGISKSRNKVRKLRKRKGRGKGHGKRKGKKNARLSKKKTWMNKVRVQRKFLKTLKEKEIVSKDVYKNLYGKVKGGFFRSKKHIKIYIRDHDLVLGEN